MAHSFYPLTQENAVEDFGSSVVRDPNSDLRYRTVRADSGFYMEEFRLDPDGNRIHSLFRKMQFVVGSGTTARTYLTESNGWYYELPLTWYTQAKKWDFSPGYQVANKRFNRKINNRCIACHNSYPTAVSQTEGLFADMPFGIGCERCHGPGALHVEERLSAPEPVGDMDPTIVNPVHLTLNQRLDICQQCHTNATVSLLREDRHAFGFRPSQNLAEFIALFSSRDESEKEGIGVISHADRMKLSACYLESIDGPNPLECTTCHDPHKGFKSLEDTYFNNVCMECHDTSALSTRLAEPADEAVHTEAANCISCHMPKTDIFEAPHSAFTDHWIHIAGDHPDVQPISSHGDGKLLPYFSRDQGNSSLYEGIAYIVYGKQNGDLEAIRSGIDILESELEDHDSNGRAFFQLGVAYQLLGQYDVSIAPLEKAVALETEDVEILNALAQSYEATDGDPIKIERLYNQALTIQPRRVDIRINLGRFLETRSRVDEAIAQYRQVIQDEPWNVLGHYNLGTALIRKGEREAALSALGKAVELDPFHAGALTNIGVAHAIAGEQEESESWFVRAVEADGDNPDALENLATLYVNSNRELQAIPLLERLVGIRPNQPDLMAKLALAYFRAERYDDAGKWARSALEMDPGHQLARQIVNAL